MSRKLLKEMAELREHTTPEQIKKAWVWANCKPMVEVMQGGKVVDVVVRNIYEFFSEHNRHPAKVMRYKNKWYVVFCRTDDSNVRYYVDLDHGCVDLDDFERLAMFDVTRKVMKLE